MFTGLVSRHKWGEDWAYMFPEAIRSVRPRIIAGEHSIGRKDGKDCAEIVS